MVHLTFLLNTIKVQLPLASQMFNRINPFYLVLIVVLAFLIWQLNSKQGMDLSNQSAPTFSGITLSGNNINLSDFQGKYVLIDFWASWCGPCRRANPKVVNLYSRFKGQDFAIISISVDNNEKAWKNAIKKDGLSWPYHLLDRPHGGKSIADQYGVESIPAKYLVDPQGVIIASNPSFRKIDRILSKKLNKK